MVVLFSLFLAREQARSAMMPADAARGTGVPPVNKLRPWAGCPCHVPQAVALSAQASIRHGARGREFQHFSVFCGPRDRMVSARVTASSSTSLADAQRTGRALRFPSPNLPQTGRDKRDDHRWNVVRLVRSLRFSRWRPLLRNARATLKTLPRVHIVACHVYQMGLLRVPAGVQGVGGEKSFTNGGRSVA
jgi:hypothetical protein